MKFKKIKEMLKGPVFPIITPFTAGPDYQVDFDAACKYVDFLYDEGVRNFYIMTYNSRFSLLSWDEMKKLNEVVTKRIKSKPEDCISIVADPMMNSTQVSVEFAQHAESIGADIISLIFLERHYSDDQVFNHFNTVAQNSNIGILIHEQKLASSKGGAAELYPLSLLDRLANIENVIALKEDSKLPGFSEKVIETVGDRLNILISGRGKRQFVHFHRMGCHGYLVGVGSFAPRVSLDFYNACLNDDMTTAWGIINEIERPFLSAGMNHGWHPALKSAMELEGVMNRVERPPLIQIQEKGHNEITQVLHRIKKSKYWPGKVD